MDISDNIKMMIWINIRVCLPFTFMVFALGCVVRLDGAPVTYYLNLLVSNIIQLSGLVAVMMQIKECHFNPVCAIVISCGAFASLCFRTIIALERYFLISWPQLHIIRQTEGYLMFCSLVWLFAIVLSPIFMFSGQYVFFVLFPLIPAPVFILCLARIPKFLPKATSLSTEEKRRIVAALVLLLVVYVFMILPLSLYRINSYFHFEYIKYNSSLILFLLSPFMDLILFVFLCKGSFDKLLSCLCCRCVRIHCTESYQQTM